MNYGLYMSASGLSTEMARQDALSNNLANVNTTAFKPDIFAVRERLAARQEDGLASLPSNAMLERLGAGVMPVAMRIGMSQGPLERTGSPLDVGIQGEGFLVVRVGAGPEGLRLTRDGRLAIGPNGRLVTAANGHPVLDVNDQPITLDPSRPVHIRSGGAITQDGGVVAQLALSSVRDPSRLQKEGNGLLRAPQGARLDRLPATGRLMQEFLEASGTDAITTMTDISSASRAASSATTVISHINQMMGQAVNTLGRTT